MGSRVKCDEQISRKFPGNLCYCSGKWFLEICDDPGGNLGQGQDPTHRRPEDPASGLSNDSGGRQVIRAFLTMLLAAETAVA